MDQLQSLVDPEQPVGGACGDNECEPAEHCDDCEQLMVQQGRAESLLVNMLSEPQPCLTREETVPAMTWQLILAAQQSDTMLPYFTKQLLGEKPAPLVPPNKCSVEFKVLANQFKHLSVSEDDNSGVPASMLFYKNSRIVAPLSIRHKLLQDTHGTGHVGVTKT